MMIQNACTVKSFIQSATKAGLLVLNVNNGHTTPVLGLERKTKLLTSHVNCVKMIDLTDSGNLVLGEEDKSPHFTCDLCDDD